jgi:hypothetical protein
MPQLILCLLLLLSCADTVLAQSATKKHFLIAKTGLVRSALNASPLLVTFEDRPNIAYTFGNSAFQTGLHAELGHEWRLFRSWRVMAGAFYRQYGGSFYRQNNVPVYENRLHYVGVAGLVRFLVLPDDKVSPYFVGGARLGRLVTSPRNEVTERLLYRDQPFTAIDVVPAVGTGLEFPLFKLRFFAEVEYSYGVGSILRSVNQYNSNFSQRAVAFTLGAKF